MATPEYRGKLSTIFEFLKAIGLFFLVFIVSLNPLLLFFPFFPMKAQNFLMGYLSFMAKTRQGTGSLLDASPLVLWTMGLRAHYLSDLAWVFLTIGGLSTLLKKSLRPIGLIFLGSLPALFNLIFYNKQGPTYVASYFFPLCFILPLGLVGLAALPKNVARISVALLLSFNLYSNWEPIKEYYFIYFKRLERLP